MVAFIKAICSSVIILLSDVLAVIISTLSLCSLQYKFNQEPRLGVDNSLTCPVIPSPRKHGVNVSNSLGGDSAASSQTAREIFDKPRTDSKPSYEAPYMTPLP